MYNNIAYVYDRLMEDAPYDQWIQFLSSFSEPKKHPHLLEVGCGTGKLTFLLNEIGYDVTAFDLSENMIEVAKQKQMTDQRPIHFFQANAIHFSLNKTFDIIVSFCDVYNYITEKDDLKSSFQSVYNHLNDDGIFIFDVHSLSYIDMLKEKEIFSEIYDDLSYVWYCSSENEGEVHHDLTFFVKMENGYFERFDEYHIQKTLSIDSYTALLKQAGFTNINVYFDFSTHEAKLDSDASRIFFVCQK